MTKVLLTLLLAFAFAFASVFACQPKSAVISSLNTINKDLENPPDVVISDSIHIVHINAPDGLILVGTFMPAWQPNSPAVLLLHQWQSDRQKRMQGKGFAVLSIDGRGFGESTKAADGITVLAERTDAAVKAMLSDVGAAFDFLSTQKNVDPARVGIVGASYGSSLALIYSANNPKVKAVALLSPRLNYFGNMQTEPAVKKYGDRPLLLVAANDDKESADSVNKLKTAGANEKYEVKIYDKGGHGTGLFNAGVGLENTLDTFLTKGLSQ